MNKLTIEERAQNCLIVSTNCGAKVRVRFDHFPYTGIFITIQNNLISKYTSLKRAAEGIER